jgi:glycosyltransferase involved in cell wall biosynthesis
MSEISVIATVLNETGSVGALVECLARQTVSPLEIVIVDGGSSDGTWEKLQAAQARYPILHAIRDESCNLKRSPGPIARGRNVAIAAAGADIIACADAGCTYAPDWLERLCAPIVAGEAEYALGGSYIDPESAGLWDIAAAAFLGVKLRPDAPTKSCTARSMAFRKTMWERVGGFPEVSVSGEDAIFDLRMRAATKPAFPRGAMARYQPELSFLSGAGRLGWYAASDGALGIRRTRFARMSLRCLAEMAAISALWWTWIPVAAVLVVEIYIAYEHDLRTLVSRAPRAIVPRLIFSLTVPWVCAIHYLYGALTKSNLPNAQNDTRLGTAPQRGSGP